MVDGPCMPPPGEPSGWPKPAEGVVLCTAVRDVMPEVPCDESRAGAVWCKGNARWQCFPSPELCWGKNEGDQRCTIVAE